MWIYKMNLFSWEMHLVFDSFECGDNQLKLKDDQDLK